MTDLLIPCGFLMAVFGLILFRGAGKKDEYKEYRKIGFWFLVLGVSEVVCCILFLAWQANEAERDRERRTVVVTGVVTKGHHATFSYYGEESFSIEYSPDRNTTKFYTFEADRSFFFNFDVKLDEPPEIGDVVRVKYIRGGYKPEVLDFYNLTKEMARVMSLPPENPIH